MLTNDQAIKCCFTYADHYCDDMLPRSQGNAVLQDLSRVAIAVVEGNLIVRVR